MATEETPEDAAPEARVNGSDVFKLAIANAIRGVNPTAIATQWISLHSSDPGSTGTPGEITAGTGAGGRQQVTWNAAQMDGATGRAKITGNTVTFSLPGAATVNFYGVWTAQQGGTYLYGKALTPGVTLTGAGTVNVTPSHSYGLTP